MSQEGETNHAGRARMRVGALHGLYVCVQRRSCEKVDAARGPLSHEVLFKLNSLSRDGDDVLRDVMMSVMMLLRVSEPAATAVVLVADGR